ncbi:MAG TPA: hypothetical protein DDX39_03450 [Bacteroidales bacterium]|nr:MAG: hypothetical protein A2W98_12870 [Bacteroidetes bacterium GWF2_33_38]OFY71421.1 MAG: hypothetical protein A2265_08390 [Bacteroidetes bacterium RIFOXYA12_FULL_33_9]OFY86069.1 MAG: hypothetical protein A2236_00495 [Bacteroidetes bacterium RIFOXYA2_FULL_33_7]HBF87675.1 hypothetical protein [Bacteroidales bacterium]
MFYGAEKSVVGFACNLMLFTFFVTLISYFALDSIQKHHEKKRAFLSLVFRVIKLLVYLIASIFILFYAPEKQINEIIILFVALYFASSFLEILHVVYFNKVKKNQT